MLDVLVDLINKVDLMSRSSGWSRSYSPSSNVFVQTPKAGIPGHGQVHFHSCEFERIYLRPRFEHEYAEAKFVVGSRSLRTDVTQEADGLLGFYNLHAALCT